MALNRIRDVSQKTFKALMQARTPYFSRQFVYMLVVSAVLILLSLTYGASRGYQIEMEAANRTLTEVEKMAGESTWFSIFLNNVTVVSLTFIPFFGVVWMIYVQYNTGWYLGAMAKAYEVHYTMVASLILTSIVGLIEYLASITALGESMILVYSATRGEFKERLIHHLWKSVVIAVLLFFVGAVVEAFLLGRL